MEQFIQLYTMTKDFYVIDESKKRKHMLALEYKPKKQWSLSEIKKLANRDQDGFQQITNDGAIKYLQTLLPKTCDCDIEGYYLRKEIQTTNFPEICIRMKIGQTYYAYPGRERMLIDRTSEQKMLDEMRKHVKPQIDEFRNNYFYELEKNGEFEVCPIINQPITRQNCQVHHYETDFCILARKFLRLKNISWTEIDTIIYSETFKEEWSEYHKTNAKLQVISAVENIITEYPNREWYPVTDATPRRNTGIKLKMPCVKKPTSPVQKKQKIERPRNAWSEHIDAWKKEKGVDYWTACKDPECQKAWREKKRESKIKN